MQPLRRDVDVDAALAVGDGQPRLRPEERLILDADVVDAADGHVTVGVRVAVADDEVANDVRAVVLAVAVRHRRPVGVQRRLLGGALHVDDRFEQLVLDADGCRSAARLLRLLGGDERDRLAVVADALGGEHGLVGELEPVRLLAGDIAVREHGVDARHPHRLRDVELDDLRVRMRAADGDAPEHPGRVQVARVGELARHLRRRVVPRGRVTDTSELELCLRARRAHAREAARRTASKIFA